MRTLVGLLILLCLVSACKKEAPPAKRGARKAPPPAPKLVDRELQEWEKVLGQGVYHTQLRGAFDPFKPFFRETTPEVSRKPLSPLEKWSLAELKLTGIVKKGRHRWALIEDPTGKGYMVKVGTRIGNRGGYVAEIGDSYILVKEKTVDFLGKERIITSKIPLRPTEGEHEIP
ncbi:pilus assembly protein PilP [Thermosulfurimonas marina]|uniref:Pilus assembly protein PilP n=1 Tax=Thermosulfurimonas marina TaxID=2047767 RepID=A0A6H1WQX5_9BACT|nr:pilus assembly protein PilP [Thermosulfurimonas marina]QJA05568.1 pilus assembly protein PilP [Thermosulfurimonas marina]